MSFQASPINSGTLRLITLYLCIGFIKKLWYTVENDCSWSESGLSDSPCWALKAPQDPFHLISRLAVMLKPCVALRVSGHGEVRSLKCADKHGPVDPSEACGRSPRELHLGRTTGVWARGTASGNGKHLCWGERPGSMRG